MNISISPCAAKRLSELLKEEGEGAVVRIREAKVGPPCKSKLVLRLSIDQREDEDVEGSAEGMPIVINQDLLEQYGNTFSLALDENGTPDVKAGQ